MGQLSARLRELVVEYGEDDRAWQPEIDALAAIEQRDAKEAHERFESLRKRLAHGRFQQLLGALRGFAWLDGLPDGDLRGASLKEVDREIVRLELALQRARSVEAALGEARADLAGLVARRAVFDATPFARVAFARLGPVAEQAEAVRRRLAAEARADGRYRKAKARSARLDLARVAIPDLSSEAVPDAAAANAALDLVEPSVEAAEKVEDLLQRVRKELRDPSVKEYKAHVRRLLGERAESEATGNDRVAAAAALEATLAEARDLRAYAAKKAEEAARARRRGGARPERERRAGDLSDYHG
ncbi:MAG TPA: hypothetical protein VI997_11470 [Candidatus Thermoplasmatota archaeon]|nr:hypothetical protein [Candidatus Thermoplasmatota archaeon]